MLATCATRILTPHKHSRYSTRICCTLFFFPSLVLGSQVPSRCPHRACCNKDSSRVALEWRHSHARKNDSLSRRVESCCDSRQSSIRGTTIASTMHSVSDNQHRAPTGLHTSTGGVRTIKPGPVGRGKPRTSMSGISICGVELRRLCTVAQQAVLNIDLDLRLLQVTVLEHRFRGGPIVH